MRWSLCESGARCLLTYVVAPFVGSLAGLLGALGLSLQLVACIVAAVSLRSLWRSHQRARVGYTVVAGVVLASTLASLAHFVTIIGGR